ncbi:acetyltransferase [Butyrivibrio sp. MC2013]|uniref:acetyltransferase n=1 Tax=Butyrivibrio sp. MC2013 TaxID=1280686 RepID=UPI00040B2EA1|nr:acetyltransferase [Butyrivibrio sp. MC2013]
MNKRKILLIGNGGHCKSVIDSVISSGSYDEVAIVDKDDSSIQVNSIKVYCDADLPRLYTEGWSEAFITVGSIGDTHIRERLYEHIIQIGFRIPSIIDPTAIVAKDTQIHDGVFVGKNAVINAGTVINECAIINSGAIIEHDCYIGEFAHISPGAILCGGVKVGKKSHIGAGTVVKQQLTIGNTTLVGVGSVIVSDIPDNVVAYGNPCRIIKENG